MSSIDKLLDRLKSDAWSAPAWATATPRIVFMKTEEEMSIVPKDSDLNSPILKIELKDSEGNTRVVTKRTLAALDDYIGRLITMRDLLEQIQNK